MQEKFFLPITFLACTILFFGWQYFLYEPTQREILSMELETRRLRNIEQEIFQLKARHEDLSAFVEAKELELDAAKNFLPTTLAQDKFIGELYQAADFCSVRLVSVQADEIISAEEFQAQIITVKLETDYISLLNFIRAVLDGERLVSLEKFSLESAGYKTISCELNFKIFSTAS